MEDVYSGGVYPNEGEIEGDEFKCLTVTLSVPLKHLVDSTERSRHEENEGLQKRKLPVMAYLHGGAFRVGKSDAVHDTAAMVAQSVDDGQPVIIASLQYRLGPLGFLATPNGALNLGLHDQRTGLEWIQRFIGGFGGDEERVTLFGESAGGYSICCHMLGWPRKKPLFNRVVIMSNALGPLMVPVAREKAENAFDDICKILGIKERGHAALDTLSSIPVQKLVEAGDTWAANGNSWRPVVDSSFFAHEHITWDTIPSLLGSCSWVDALIIGNTGFESTSYLSVAQSLTPQTFQAHLSAGLSEEATTKVVETYNITPKMDQNLFVHAAAHWLGDTIFYAPIHALCNHLCAHTDKKVYRYVFDVGNPFVGAPLFKVPHHWVDVYFLFRTLQFRFPTHRLKDTSDKHSNMWVAFANGKAPWAEYGRWEEHGGDNRVVMVADEVEGWTQRTLGDDEVKSDRSWARLDNLWDAWNEKVGEEWLPLRLTEIVGAKKGGS